MSHVPAGDWIIGNLKHAGFYRVNYDENNWNLLINQLNEDHNLINSISRAALLDDSFNLGRAEIIDQTVYLDIASYLEKETDPLPYGAVTNGLSYIYNMLASDTESFDLMNVILTENLNIIFIRV